MAISLYDLGVLTFLQTMRAMSGVLDRTARHCVETGADPDDFVHARLHPDMAPFHFQIEALKNHAVWGLEAVKTGVFAPPPLVGAMPFTDLRAIVGQAVTALEAFTPEEINSWSGKDLDIDVHRPVDEDKVGLGPSDPGLHVGDLPPLVLAAQLLFPRRYGLRHPAHTGRADRKGRLRGPAAHEAAA